ncbi:MAG: amino acid adenylation domain-containing protein [Janthinobacterium sp.]
MALTDYFRYLRHGGQAASAASPILAPCLAQEHADFWRQHLHGAPALLELPSERPRPARQSWRTASVPFMLDAGTMADVHRLAGRCNVAPPAVLLAAWATFLSRLSGQHDLVIGTGQHDASIAPLRLRLDEDCTGLALLAQADETLRLAARHAVGPLAQLVEALQPARSTSFSPLFQTLLAFGPHAAGESPCDLALILDDSAGGGYAGRLDYAQDLFDADCIAAWGDSLRQLLQSLLADPAAPLARLDLLSPAQRRVQLQDWNASALELGPLRNAHDFIDAQAARAPERDAIVHDGQRVSYGALARRANDIAAHLLALGVRPGELVGLHLRRGPQLVAGLMGILKAGAAYVPLDPAYPAERLAFMRDDAGARLVLGERALQASLPAGDHRYVAIDDIEAGTASVSVAVDPASPAYVIYTSGSTGRPKGVLLPHRALVNFFAAMLHQPGMTAADTVCAVTTLSFDIAVLELLLPFTVGATVAIADTATAADGLALADLIDACGATLVQATPATWRMLLDAGWKGRPGLRIISGGEPMTRELADGLLPRVAQLWNLYGPTETTIYSTGEQVLPGEGLVTIGKPVSNTRVYLVDRHLQPVPVGVPGELLIGGLGVASGYHARPALTAEKFIADPFSGVPGSLLYRTGDLVRWTPDGRLDMLGRIDNQVKLRGFRIELGEIEAVLASHPACRQAVVVCREDRPGDKRLAAYVRCAAEDGAATIASLRALLAQAVPSYMVPPAFVLLEHFPMTPNGKVDRRALPVPGRAALSGRQVEAPLGAQEMLVARLWRELLGLEEVGRHDDFFELGGHSLLAGQLLSRLRRASGTALTLRQLFGAPTVAGLAAILDSAPASAALPALAALALPADGKVALSYTQQRLWFLSQLDAAAGAAYHMPVAWRLRGPLDAGALRGALDALLARHAILRTHFGASDGVPHQLAGAAPALPLAEEDISALPPERRDAAAQALYAAQIAQPFDLARGPLLRAMLLRRAPEEHELLLVQHHIVSDGWSLGVLRAELAALYAAFSAGLPDPLPAPAFQYADYAHWQRHPAHAATLRAQQAYWRAQLDGAPALLALPLERPRPARQSYRGARLAFALAPPLAAALRQLGARHGATLFMTLLAGWSALLSRLGGQDDIVIGTPVANRPLPELEALPGFFVNTLALRVRLHGDPTVAALLARIRATALAAYEHQDLPLDQVVDAVRPVRSLAYSPLFQSVLALDNTPAADGDGTLFDPRPLPLPQATTHFDLSLLLDDDGRQVTGHIEYASDLFDHDGIARLAASLQAVLAAMAADDDLTLGRLPLMDAAARRQVLQDFNRATVPPTREATVHALFQQQAARTPQALALRHGARSLTYAALDAQANRQAHALLAAGVQPGQRVLVLLERGDALVSTLLAILKAGAAYVPVEANCPPQRLAHILADAAPALVVSSAALACRLPAGGPPPLLVETGAELAPGLPETTPGVSGIDGAALAYVMYTSGSTGTPKGVMVEHRNIVRLAVDSGFAPLRGDDRVAYCANPAFDAATWELWAPLLNGASLLVLDQDTVLAPARLNRALADGGATALWLTAGLFHEYADALEEAFGGLRWLLAGGDVLDPQVVARVMGKARPPRQLLNGYGPTETTTFATTYVVRGAPQGARAIPIGRPIGNTQVYLLDPLGQPVPVGVAGELHIGGDGVARGYLNLPRHSAERFIADPFSGVPGARLYRSGDLGKWRADGTIEFAGRNDFQVKIRGYRIEPGEIETRLAACAGVREALVLAREDSPGDKRLVAYLTAAADFDVTAAREALRAQLPAYMLPAAFVVLARWPLNANGKVDRQALPDPAMAAAPAAAPLSAEQETLARLWRPLLRGASVQAQDSFFDIGGNSLLATRLVARIGQHYGIDFPLRAIFDAPCLAPMADAIALQLASQHAEALDELLKQLDNLSDEQASAQLQHAPAPVGDSPILG